MIFERAGGSARGLAAALALLVDSLGCAPAARTPHDARETSALPVASSAPTTDTASSQADSAAPRAPRRDDGADRVVAAALLTISRLRELAVLAPVRGVTLSREAMGAQVRRAIDRDVPADVIAAQGELLVALGLVPASFDYRAAIVSLMSSQLAGYYEPAEKTLYLVSDLAATDKAATLSHELVHALQDQHYDLGKLLEYRVDASDAQTAVHALAEGDAMSAMLDEMLAPRGARATDLSEALLGAQMRASSQLASGAADVPDILKRSLVAPYADGIAFVHFLRRRGDWAEVDKAWRSPPSSTEQLLHPEKLLAGEVPVVVPAPSPPPGGPAEAVFTDVLGEQSARLTLEEWIPRRSAEAGAAGWGGDRVRVFHSDDRYATAVHFRADSAEAATRQAAAWSRGVAAQGGTVAASGAACAERPDRGPLRVERRGRDVVVVAGPYRRAGGVITAAARCLDAAAWAAQILDQR